MLNPGKLCKGQDFRLRILSVREFVGAKSSDSVSWDTGDPSMRMVMALAPVKHK